jgi:hypothetical protein
MQMEQPPSVGYNALRYFLAVAFLVYGGVKLADIQFNPKFQPYLFQPRAANDLSGMELVWRFFGHSRVYQCMAGLAEVVSAGLLLSIRTAPLGAVMYLAVIGNVVAVDLCYRVSTDATVVALSLLAGDLLLLLADRRRLLAALATAVRPRTNGTTWRRTLLAWGLAVVLLVIVFGTATLVMTIRGY